MKSLLFISLFVPVLAFGFGPHVPLDLSIEETQKLWETRKGQKDTQTEPHIQKAIKGGEILNKWLAKINENRRSDNQLRLTSSNSRGSGIPINKPGKYGPKTLKADLEKVLAESPKEMLDVIYNGKEITGKNPITDELFIQHGRKISRLYQYAVRWETVIKPWMSYFKQNKRRDVRGFYYLEREENLKEKLDNFSNLSNEDQKRLGGYLKQTCINNNVSKNICNSRFKRALKKKALYEFKVEHWQGAKKNWDSFFKISNPRKDVKWDSSTPNTMKVIFKDPKNERIANWLKENIEDEFQTDTWQMEFNFVKGGLGVAYLKFKPNVTPHVTGGNIIVMDANASIEEYSVQWTIRHEYGHILRLPDCYIEFYDEEEELAVNYQFDVTDLMCSRSGDFNKRIYDELKRVYYKK